MNWEDLLRTAFQTPEGGGQDGTYHYSAKKKTKASRPARGTPFTRVLWSLLAALVFGAIYFYLELPALNFHNDGFYWFIFLLVAVFTIALIIQQGVRGGTRDYASHIKRNLKIPFFLTLALIAVVLVGSLTGWVLFRAPAYSSLLKTDTGDFAADVDEVSWDHIPLLDKDSANNLANRKLGELSDLVSQFTVSEASVQINYQNAPVRVTYLDYGGIIKWWNNRSDGIPAYLVIDMTTQQVDVVRMEQGMKYSPSEYFNRDLMRHLRFQYPTTLFGDVNFEIDEDGTPYWVASVITKTIGLFGGEDVIGAVLLNAQTGESTYCTVDEVPAWVDRVYPADLLIQQYDYYGQYHNGFWNSIFGQNNCTVTTDGYNYIAQNDDVWLYTGITSVTGDRGNIGFILVNQRTKEAHYYACAGAEEYSAVSSAEGAVQQFGYQATFPLLLNISDQPTYFMALKDAAGLVKMYAMVNVQQYQIVAIGSSVSECQTNYHNLLVQNNVISDQIISEEELTPATTETRTGVLTDLRSICIGGTTIFYLQLDGDPVYFTVSAANAPETVLLNVGDTVSVTYLPTEGQVLDALTLERQAAAPAVSTSEPAAEEAPAADSAPEAEPSAEPAPEAVPAAGTQTP